MAVNTSSGCQISIGTTASDASTDSYTLIGFVTDGGEFGRQYAEIKFDDIASRDTLKFKGQRDDGNMTLKIGRDTTDSGQAAVLVALESDQDYNFKVELNDSSDTTGAVNTIFYFKAKVMTYPTIIGTPTSVVGGSITLALKSGSITETPAT